MIKSSTKKQSKPRPKPKSLWNGPEKDGITFSLLSRFLVCRERFRLHVVEGLKEDLGFNHHIEYGSMWHGCEEAYTQAKNYLPVLQRCTAKLRSEYPGHETAINKWSTICRVQFPLYVNYWANHPDTFRRKYLLQEEVFRVPYKLPSGRIVALRGKWDAVFREGKGIYLQENKTKGTIDEEAIQKTVVEDLQTMLYLIAFNKSGECPTCRAGFRGTEKVPVKGILYNVIRRPLSDRYAIRQKKSETERQFYERLGEVIAKRPDHYFHRWKVQIYLGDVLRFKREVFEPILEDLCDWWEHIEKDPFNPWRTSEVFGRRHIHFRFPFGVYNSLAAGYRGDYFDYLTTGSKLGLQRVNTLYAELEN